MEQKTTRRGYVWMHYLLFGISALLLCSCRREYRVSADFVYKNETDYKLSYNYIALDSSDTIPLLELEPKSEKIFTIDGEGDENPNIKTCCEGFLDGIQGHGFPILIIFDDSRCFTYQEGEGPTTSNISNYEAKSIGDRHFEYTYRFTEDDFLQAKACE